MKSFVATLMLSVMLQQGDPEARIVEYLRTHTTPGRPVVVSDLLNNVFKTPEEQKALQRLFNTFFKIPLTAAQLYTKTNKVPTLKQLSDQFGFNVPGEMDVILKVMEADPRIPRFFERNPRTGEITKIDVAAIKGDPRFAQAVERTIAGWEGRPEPAFSIKSFAGQPLTSAQFAGKPHLMYFWFSNCPPCLQTTPLLVKLQGKYGQGFQIVAANADRVLELPYNDGVRAEYLKKNGANFTTGHVTAEMQQAFGGLSVYPTLFFVNSKGQIVKQFVGFHDQMTLDAAIKEALK